MVLRSAPGTDYELVYFNADGSRAELCGNASLCSVRLAVELGYADPSAVRFLTDSGVVIGRMTDGLPEAQKEALLRRIPVGDLGSGEDIGAAAVYLASREAGYVTGQTLHVNGGMAMI